MKAQEYYLMDVFTNRIYSGNPLAVFPKAESIDASTMQAIANELNLSETVFVNRISSLNRYPIRIFTPTAELPFAGHPIIGTAHLLVELGMVVREEPLTLEAGVGPLVVAYEKELACFAVAAPLNIQASTLDSVTAAELLGLDARDVVSQPVLASCGLPYHLVELGSLKALERAHSCPKIWAESVSPSGYDQIYLYVVENVANEEGALSARMFCDAGGQREDPATGSAAAALVGKLAVDNKISSDSWRWRISQGVEMNRPSLILAQTEYSSDNLKIHIAGEAVIVGTGMLWAG